MNIDGSNVVKIASSDDGLDNISHHCWSPDSQWLAFKAWEDEARKKGEDDCGARIFKAKVDGSVLTKLSPEPENLPEGWGEEYGQNWPQWSPDGKWISTSICTNSDYNYKKLAIMDANGGNLQAVMEQDGEDDGDIYDCISPHFSWSPDSNWLVYVMDACESYSYTALCMSNIYNGDFYQLTKGWYDSQPRWSPAANGKPGSILFKSDNDSMYRKEGGNGLFLLNLAPWALDSVAASGRTDFSGCGSTSWAPAGICMNVTLGAGCEEPFFIGALYEGNPTPSALDGTFWDIYCPYPANVISTTLGLYFNGYFPDMSFYWYDEDAKSWAGLDPAMLEVAEGIYEKAGITYTAVVSMTLTADTTPSLSQLDGTVFAAGTLPEEEEVYPWAGKDNDTLNCFVKSLDTPLKTALPYGAAFMILLLGFGAFFKRAVRE